jgi:hypothetical protein
MNLDDLQKKGKKVAERVSHEVGEKGKQAIDKVTQVTQERVSAITEDAIFAAVDRAIDVIEIASQRIQEREIPTENVALEVSVKITGVAELKIKADVPKSGEVEVVNLDVVPREE